jgi:DNA-binding GntR family transcriptional regulator
LVAIGMPAVEMVITGRLSMEDNRAVYEALSIDRASTVDRVVDELRRALFEGELSPGTPLREIALADRLGVARSTVREAMGTLAAEGLVTRIPNRGVAVAQLTAADVRDVTRARAVLELAGVRAWPSASEPARDAVREALARFAHAAQGSGRPAALSEAHLGVHRAFTALVGSARLDAVALGLTHEIRLALATVDRIRRNARQQVAEHRALVALLERGAIDDAAAGLAQHLESAERSQLQALQLD